MPGRTRVVCGALVTAIMPVAAPARADVGVAAIAARGAPDGEAAVADAIGQALAARGEAVVADVGDAARAALDAGAVPADALGGFARVATVADEGWRAYLEVQPEFALARLGEARREAEEVVALDGGLAVYADVALRLGAVLESAARPDEADDVLRLAAALDPAREVTVQEFSPDVVAAYARARGVTPARRALQVRVTGDGAPVDGARVEIDGVAIDAAGEVALGQHVVVARAPGRRARGQTVSVTAGDGAAEVEVALDPDPAPAALAERPVAGQRERTTAAWLEAAATYGEVDAIVLAASVWRSGRPALLAQWCADGRCTAVVELGYDAGAVAAAAREAVDELAAADRRYGPSLPSDPRLERLDGPPIPHRCRWCRPALYAGAAVVVAAAAVAAIAVAATGAEGRVIGLDPGDFTR